MKTLIQILCVFLALTTSAFADLGDWSATGQITNSTTAAQLRAAQGDGVKNYVSGFTLASATLGAATEFMIRSTPVASTTATIAGNTLVMAASYDWQVGDMVLATASTVTGLTAGTAYYIKSVNGPNLTFSTTRGGTTASISGTGVAATLAKVLFRSQLQTTAMPIQYIALPAPANGGVNLAIEAAEITATTGRIDFNVYGFSAP